MSAFGKKTRADAWGADLPEETRWDIYNLTKPPRDGEERRYLSSYEEARKYLLDPLNMTPPSRGGWYRFLARMRQEERVEQVARVASSCETAKDMADEAAIDFAGAAEALMAKALDATMDGDVKAAAVYSSAATAFRSEARKSEELRLAREKFDLLKAKEAKAVEAVSDAALTDEERVKKIKSIFGI